jgi:hypothetical protein
MRVSSLTWRLAGLSGGAPLLAVILGLARNPWVKGDQFKGYNSESMAVQSTQTSVVCFRAGVNEPRLTFHDLPRGTQFKSILMRYCISYSSSLAQLLKQIIHAAAFANNLVKLSF